MGISRSTYYKKYKTESNKKEEQEEVILLFKKKKGRYGKRRLKEELRKAGTTKSIKKIAKILRENKLVAKGGRNHKKRKKEIEAKIEVKENIIKDKYSIEGPDRLICGDISQIKCVSGWIYISGIIDVYTREIVGYGIAMHMRGEIVIESIKMAIGRYRYTKETIFHSDNGMQYLSKRTQEIMEMLGIQTSRSRVGKPMDNQPIESFWKTLKQEIGEEIRVLKYNVARLELVRYIGEYNNERIHSSLGYQTPREYRENFISKASLTNKIT